MINNSQFTQLGSLTRIKEALLEGASSKVALSTTLQAWVSFIESVPSTQKNLIRQGVLVLLDLRMMILVTQLNSDEESDNSILTPPESVQKLHSELIDIETRILGMRTKMNKLKLQHLAQGYGDEGLSYLTNWGK